MTRPRLATVWLDGCSGCHMSFLDMDERLLEIGERAELVCWGVMPSGMLRHPLFGRWIGDKSTHRELPNTWPPQRP